MPGFAGGKQIGPSVHAFSTPIVADVNGDGMQDIVASDIHTIVVYDRIREGLASGKRGTIEEIMNASINQTLSRTILTSTVTLIPIVFLFFMGGAVLRDFSLAIIIGVVVGTYSSIFIASPIVLWWTRARGRSTSSLRREIIQKKVANPTAS